jgi:2'-5' RNA ligase
VSSPTPCCAIVAYPALTVADRDWIESVRARHDPQADLIAAHVTLGFPAAVDHLAAVRAAAGLAGSSGPFPFAVGAARAVPDQIGGGAHVFLVVDEGRETIAALHGRLYAGALAPHHRPAIPFIPHITIARHPDIAWCRDFAANVNRTLPRMRGTIDALEVIALGAGYPTTIARLALGAMERA